jgi:glutathione S-transferase
MLRPMKVKLYALSASHPVAAVEAALRLKGIDYQRVDMLPIVPVLWGPLRYGGTTVPGVRMDGERLVGSRPIMHRLEELVPEPPLLPAPGSDARAEVLEAERWGDEDFQSVPRRIIDVAFLHRPAAM